MKIKLIATSGFFLLILIIVVLFNLANGRTQESQIKQKEILESRFELVETILLFDDPEVPSDYQYSTRVGGRVFGKIYRDKVTGVEYLYSWIGSAHGGPMMTRYYRK